MENKKTTVKKAPAKKKPVAKKEPVKKKPVTKKAPAKVKTIPKETSEKATVKETLPKDVLARLKIIRSKYYKDDAIDDVIDLYLEEYGEIKERYKNQKWADRIFHKRALASFANKKKKERIGGAVDSYYAVILGISQSRDLSQKGIDKIVDMWKNDPDKAIKEGFIMTRVDVNPTTGEEEKIPITDKEGNIIPRDNREFFERKTGGKFRNPNFSHPYAHSYRKAAIGVVSNKQGKKGVCLLELRDKAVDLEIEKNVLLKFSARTAGTNSVEFKLNEFILKETIDSLLEDLKVDYDQGLIEEDYLKTMGNIYTGLVEDGKEVDMFKLTSSRGTIFTVCETDIDFERAGFPVINKTKEIDIDSLYKEYFFPYTSECARLLEYHNINQYIDNNPENKNYDEFVVLQNVDVLQINLEESMSGNYKLYVYDSSLELQEVLHNENLVDSVLVLFPPELNIDFGSDSKVNIVGSVFQFQAQDENREPIYEETTDEEGEPIKIPVMDYPMIKAYGIYAVPQYKVEIETIDLVHDDEVKVEKETAQEEREKELIDEEEFTEEEIEEVEEAINQVIQEDLEEGEEEEPEETEEEGEEEEPDIW